jgi:intracellular multiplication protein IcmD
MVRNILSNKRSLVMLVLMVSMFLAAPAMADDLGGVADRIKEQLGSFADLLTGGMFLVGIGLGAMAALKFKAHNEDPRSTKITTPIVLLIVSACLIGLPAWLTLSANSVLGEGDRSSLDESVYGNIN